MTNFKKLLKINYGIGKGVFQGIFTMYLIAVGLVLLHSLPNINPSLTASILRGVFYIFSTVILFYIPLMQLNRKFMISIPIDNLNTYPLSIFISQVAVLIPFYLVYLILAIFLNESFYTSGMVWSVNILFFTSLLKTYYKDNVHIDKETKESVQFLLTFICILVLALLGEFLFKSISKYIELSIFFTILLSIALLLRVLTFKTKMVYRENIQLKYKSKNNKKLTFKKESKLSLIFKLKKWSVIKSNDIILFLFTIIFIIVKFLTSDLTITDKIYYPILFFPFLFISLYDFPKIYSLTIGIPIDINKMCKIEKFIKLIMFTVTILLIYIFFSITKINLYENFIKCFMSSIIVSLFILSIYEFLFSNISTLFWSFVLIGNINSKHLMIQNNYIIIALFIIAISLYFLSYIFFKNSVNKHGIQIIVGKSN
ncbi:hypothetical protein SAMN02745245_00491 [Anaerosphaera aminiphila DSM 21120]|uniref:Uncharacterized protein n=1 Tax=Anaerosphaera aminiphila DSM 21120 TaxID=1120995 RepID=A0A1M5PUY0_9FIRM|nr:hypothetical protein [Anaerosphaera aminiphila]SHH05827.1 hypothetical protein SAMN02745245_00491 [Anaerosphaera aminiphila DSM 21120]